LNEHNSISAFVCFLKYARPLTSAGKPLLLVLIFATLFLNFGGIIIDIYIQMLLYMAFQGFLMMFYISAESVMVSSPETDMSSTLEEYAQQVKMSGSASHTTATEMSMRFSGFIHAAWSAK